MHMPPLRNVRTALGTAAILLSVVSATASEVASGVYGVMTLTIRGHGGRAADALSFLGLGLTRPILCQGNLESVMGKVVTDAQAHWADDQFNGSNGMWVVAQNA